MRLKPEQMDDELDLANQAYDSVQHEDDLAPILEHLDIPNKTKADMWESKRQMRIQATDPKRAKLEQFATIPNETLDKAEAHPKTLQMLMAEEKPEGQAGLKTEKSGLKKEAGGTHSKENANNPTEQDTNQAAQAQGLPPMPPGTTHVKASDGSEHYIPHQNLGQAAKRDPGLKILRSA